MRDGRVLVAGALVGLAMVGRRGSRAQARPPPATMGQTQAQSSTMLPRVKSYDSVQRRLEKKGPTEAQIDAVQDRLDKFRSYRRVWDDNGAYQFDIKMSSMGSLPQSVVKAIGQEHTTELLWEKVSLEYEHYLTILKSERPGIYSYEQVGRSGGGLLVWDLDNRSDDLDFQWGDREMHIKKMTLLGPIYEQDYLDDLTTMYIGALQLADDLVAMQPMIDEHKKDLGEWLESEQAWEFDVEQHGSENRRRRR